MLKMAWKCLNITLSSRIGFVQTLKAEEAKKKAREIKAFL